MNVLYHYTRFLSLPSDNICTRVPFLASIYHQGDKVRKIRQCQAGQVSMLYYLRLCVCACVHARMYVSVYIALMVLLCLAGLDQATCSTWRMEHGNACLLP